MKVRRFLLTKNPGQKQRGELFLLNVPPSCPKNPGQEKNECEAFFYQNNWTRKNEGATFFCLPKILDKKRVNYFGLMSHLVTPKNPTQEKNERGAFFYQKFWTRNKWTWGIFFLNAPTSHQNNPGREKNEGATFFCLPKILGKEGKYPGPKKGRFFLLSVPPSRPKILDKKK